MVIKRTIRSLKDRPHDEQHAFAVMFAIAVMIVVAAAWAIFFFESIQTVSLDDPYQGAVHAREAPAQGAAAAASIDSIVHSTITNLPAAPGAQIGDIPDTNTSGQIDILPDAAPSTGAAGSGDAAGQLQAALQQ